MRHIDSLEEALGVTLFQRNDKGYIATEAGLDIMRLGEITETHFAQLPNKLKQNDEALEGSLSITSIADIASMIMPSILRYQQKYPKMRIDYLDDIRNFKLEYGEADIAIRAGKKPTTPDNIVLPLIQVSLTFAAHKSYIEKHGLPSLETLSQHRFVALKDRPNHLVWNEWIYQNIADENIIFKSANHQVLAQVISKGGGIGAMPKHSLEQIPDLVEVPTPDDWQVSIWVLVHRDMYNMPKIKAFIDLLRQDEDMLLTLA
ncbi:hypothetical protein TW85_16560 [Marinomonas sp. S3726]|nr:hypothetical protein TW85_16560 [Marinomonas sp. S3726]